MRSHGTVNFKPLDIWRCINYGAWRPKWDKHCDAIYFMSKEGAGAYTLYNRTKKVFVVAGRDFLFDYFTYQEPDGTILVVISTNKELYDKVAV